MIRLALDTSTPLGSVAIADGPDLLAERELPVRVERSATVLPEIERLLREAGGGPTDVEAVVVGAGPGSFTGVRIAASLAKGLSFGRSVPLFAYSSLLAEAAATELEGGVCALFDARRGQVYAAAYRRVVPAEPELAPAALALHELLDLLDAPRWTFAGDGALRHREAIRHRGGRVPPDSSATPRATALLRLADRWPEGGRVEDPAGWEPEYVRRSGALRAAERRARGGTAAGGTPGRAAGAGVRGSTMSGPRR